MNKTTKLSISLFLILFSSAFLLIGCSDSTSPSSNNVTISAVGTSSVSDNFDSLRIDMVKLLIRDIKLNVNNASSDSTNFKVGPFVLYVNPDSSLVTFTSALIPAGSYDKIKFEIHKAAAGEVNDTAFTNGGNFSVVVSGAFNNEPFYFKSDKSAHQKLNFPSVMPVTEDAVSNITLRVEPYKWFFKSGVLLNPNDPANENDIENNITENINDNIKGFKDNNKDGIPD